MTSRYDMTFREVCELLDQKDAEILELKAEVEKCKRAIQVLIGAEPEEETEIAPEANTYFDEPSQEDINSLKEKVRNEYPFENLYWQPVSYEPRSVVITEKDLKNIVAAVCNNFD